MRPTALALLALTACGGHGALFVTVEGRGPLEPLRIPQEVDALLVHVTTTDGGKTLLDKRYDLNGDQQFPLTLGLEPQTDAIARVRLSVVGLKGDATVASAEALVAMNPGSVTSETLVLAALPP